MENKEIIAKIRNVNTNLTDLAQRSGVSIRTLIYIRTGKANPTFKTLEKLGKAMKERK